MSSVVFLRGVNVGGHKTFRPSELAGRLAKLRVVSIGAAGTFVVHADAGKAEVRSAFTKALPFEAHLMICPARDVIGFLKTDPFSDGSLPKADGQFITVVEKCPRSLPTLPRYVPEGRDWQVALVAVQGSFVVTLHRRVGRNPLYPNEVVEKLLGVASTTRGWPTILKVRQALEKG